MTKEQTKTSDALSRVEYKEKEKEIWVHGHYQDWLCGFITGVCWLTDNLSKANLKGEVKSVVVRGNEYANNPSDDPHLISIYKFKTKKLYNIVVETLQDGFERYEDRFAYRPVIDWDKVK